MVFQAAKRIAQLDAAHEGLVFGRLDLRAELDADPRYVGRIGLRDDNHDSLLIDWRAPAAAVFYQATAADPKNVVRRRVLRSVGPTVVSVEDELLDAEAGTDLPIVGEGALMAQLSRARDRSMHSIVATIQAEQDRAIRAPSRASPRSPVGRVPARRSSRCTARRTCSTPTGGRYESGGVLVVGPSGVFMRYIERVLPSLGETAVALRSLGEVVDGVRATRHDEPAVADVKGSARMAELMRRTSRQQSPGSPREFRIFWRDDVIMLDAGKLGQLRRQLMGQGRRNRQIPRVASSLLDLMWRQVRGERGSRAWPRGLQRRDALQPVVRRLRRRVVAAARRADGARLAARPRLPGPRRRRRAVGGAAAAAVEVVGFVGGHPVGRGRTAARRAPLRARRRTDARRGGPRARRLPRWRRAGADVGGGARVRLRRPRAGRRRPTASRTTRSPTC